MLSVENLEYHYGSSQVLKNLSCHLMTQQLGMLVGQNGAGKSTFLHCIAGWATPSEGIITFNDVSLGRDERYFRKHVILIPDTPDFYDELTAWEHFQLIAQLHKIPRWTVQAEKLMTEFDLFDQRNTFPFMFSRGMRYKLALGLALLVHPPLLLLDEPFGPLDVVARQNLWSFLKEYVQSGGTVLYSSHGISVSHLPDIILHLHHGRIDMVKPNATTDLSELFRDVS